MGDLASPVGAVYDPTGLVSGTDEGWSPHGGLGKTTHWFPHEQDAKGITS